jgi:VWFA-related protein
MRMYVLTATALLFTATLSWAEQQPTFPSRVDLVTVDVVVFDRQGRPVEGLTRDDFTIREDGRAQAISAFEGVSLQESAPARPRTSRISTNDERPDVAGRWFFVVFDDVHITPFGTTRAREAIVQFIERALRPGDRVMIASSSGGSTWTGEMPQDRDDLLAYVGGLQGGRRLATGADRIWDYEAMAISLGRDPQAQAQVARRHFESGLIQEAELKDAEVRENFRDVAPGLQAVRIKARQTYAEARARLAVSLGTLERMTAALAAARGRKTLLFFSEGFIMDTTLGAFGTVLQAARTANVAVHFIDVRGAGGTLGQPGLPGGNAEVGRATQENDSIAMAFAAREEEGTRSIATDTGGSVVTGTNLLPGLVRIANEGRTYYLLAYSPTNTARDGKFRKIDVTVDRRDVTVRARGGYFAATSERESPPVPDSLDPAIRAALDAPFGARGIPMRLTSYVFGPHAAGKVRTLLVAEADPAPLRLQPRNGRYSATLDSYVLVHHRSRESPERNERVVELSLPPEIFAQLQQRGIPVLREFALEPGRYQATVLLRDRTTGAIGSVRHEFEVPGPNQFSITTPIVTDIVQPGNAAGEPPRPVPIARRTFKAGTRIAAAFDVLGAADAGPDGSKVSVAHTLRRADGTSIVASQPQALTSNASGQFAVAIGLALPSGALGEHELTISVRDEVAGRLIEHVEPLIITP